MKTLLLSADDIQNFSKLIYDPKATAQLASSSGVGVASSGVACVSGTAVGAVVSQAPPTTSASCNLMALQYYLKHPSSYTPANVQLQRPAQPPHPPHPPALSHTHTHVKSVTAALAQSQTQLKQLQLKQPTIHQQQHASYHPYYQQQQQQPQTQQSTPATTHAHAHAHALPVHALNQNSNFSAASSSTGGGTASSHAPTQQSNTTGSSLSPPAAATANARNTPANATNANSAAAAAALARNSTASGTKKLKTEPVLSQFNQTERLTFANTHIVWSEQHWKRVVFQDERKFNLDGPDGFSYYFHDLRNYERTLSQRPRGNSVYIYLLITAGGPVHMEVATAKQKPETCIETILRERVNIQSKLGVGGSATNANEFVLQDHNWTANALPSAQAWLNAEGIKTQKWPTISHDLNIMEQIWGWLIREVYDGGRKFSRKDDLIFRIREAWARLPVDLITNLYSTLPERIQELYYTRGIYTNC